MVAEGECKNKKREISKRACIDAGVNVPGEGDPDGRRDRKQALLEWRLTGDKEVESRA